MRRLILVTLFLLFGYFSAAYATPTLIVKQTHGVFDMEALTVGAGSTVVFENKDDVIHNIQITDAGGNSIDKGLQRPGDEIKETFGKAGVYTVHCALHPKMKMKLTVQ